MREQVGKGHQAYVVYPVIEGPKDDQPELDFALPEEVAEEKPAKKSAKKAAKTEALFAKPSPKLPLKSATDMYERLRDDRAGRAARGAAAWAARCG